MISTSGIENKKFLKTISGPPAKVKGQKGIDFYFKSEGKKEELPGNPKKKPYKGKRLQ